MAAEGLDLAQGEAQLLEGAKPRSDEKRKTRRKIFVSHLKHLRLMGCGGGDRARKIIGGKNIRLNCVLVSQFNCMLAFKYYHLQKVLKS